GSSSWRREGRGRAFATPRPSSPADARSAWRLLRGARKKRRDPPSRDFNTQSKSRQPDMHASGRPLFARSTSARLQRRSESPLTRTDETRSLLRPAATCIDARRRERAGHRLAVQLAAARRAELRAPALLTAR